MQSVKNSTKPVYVSAIASYSLCLVRSPQSLDLSAYLDLFLEKLDRSTELLRVRNCKHGTKGDRILEQIAIMCYKVTCEKCKKTTWKGCGKHADEVMKDVPEDQRCTCKREKDVSHCSEKAK